LISCTSQAVRDLDVAKALDAADASTPPRSVQREAAVDAVFTAAGEAVGSEMTQVLSQKPTEQGAAELEELITIGIDLDRSAQLSGMPDEATAPFDDQIMAAATYHYDLIRSVCLGPQQPSSDIFISYMYEALGAARQMELLGGAPGDISSVILACANRIKLQLQADDDATTDHSGGWTTQVVVNDTATLRSSNLEWVVSGTTLTFTTNSAKADPGFAASGGSASMTAENGTFVPANMGTGATRRVHCDKNRQFSYERHTYLFLDPVGIWDDHETVTISDGGVTVPEPDSVAATAWVQALAASEKPQLIQLEIGKDAFTKQSSGTCTVAGGDYCSTFAFNATLKVTALPN
jgi:hypothetical protein